MSLAKALIGIAALGAVYFLFFANSMPRQVEFRGQALGPVEQVENNSVKDFDIYRYSDDTNRHVLVLLVVSDEAVPADQLQAFYAEVFKAQGFNVRQRDDRHFGVRNDEVLYMAQARRIDAAVAYIEKAPSPMPGGFRDADAVFSDLENFVL